MRQEIGESVVRHRGTVDGLRITVPKRLKGIKEQIKKISNLDASLCEFETFKNAKTAIETTEHR
jgi:hypothetical protein